MRNAARAGVAATARPPVRPQSLMLAFLGEYVLDQRILVFSGSLIEVFARVGVSEQATRSTLARMVQRNLLRRRRQGRRMYFGLTSRSEELLGDGGRRVWERGVINTGRDTEWTLIGFSFPDAWKRQRHELRTRLTWAGFGLLHGGLWIAPSRVEIREILEELGLREHVKVFTGRPMAPTDIGQLVHDAYDLAALSANYHAFLSRWDTPQPEPAGDPLARKLLLTADWLGTIREDPCLPLELLPEHWPAARAQQVFRERHAALVRPARQEAEEILETIPED